MDHPRPCGCKGCRTCLKCEAQFGIKTKDFAQIYKSSDQPLSFCAKCCKVYKGWDVWKVTSEHPHHNNERGIEFPGMLVLEEFLSADETHQLISNLDEMAWDVSQSGRRKQNFGPKTNFKKMKLVCGNFEGFPQCTQFVQDKLKDVPLMSDFRTVEQCSLEYDPANGASIDPHIDDCWIWGERVVTVNCLGDSVLTLAPYTGDSKKYNLPIIEQYKSSLISPLWTDEEMAVFEGAVVRIPMPVSSLIVMYGSPRYQWEHSVLREDVKDRRVCIAYREFTPMYLYPESKGTDVLQQSILFWDHNDGTRVNNRK